MLKNLVWKFYNETYRQYVLITFSREKFEKMTGMDTSNAGGAVCFGEDAPLLMWLQTYDNDIKIDLTDAAHESFHVADCMADAVGLEYKYNSGNEHMAYLIGWVMGCVLDAQDSERENLQVGEYTPDLLKELLEDEVQFLEIDEDQLRALLMETEEND